VVKFFHSDRREDKTKISLTTVLALVVAPFLLAGAMSAQSWWPGQHHEETLPSGRKIKFSEKQHQDVSCGFSPSSCEDVGNRYLELWYETGLKVGTTTAACADVALRKEVDEIIWPIAKRDTERLKLKEARIRVDVPIPKSDPSGPIAVICPFVFQKGDDGSWQCLNDKPKSAPKQKE
jgi:hypothetical protein